MMNDRPSDNVSDDNIFGSPDTETTFTVINYEPSDGDNVDDATAFFEPTKLNNSGAKDELKKDSYNNNRFTGREPKKSFNKSPIDLSNSAARNDFVNKLEAKLKDLEVRKKKRNVNGGATSDNRPLFITTVKTGIFLDPPPELAALLGYPRSTGNGSSGTSSQKSSEALMYSFSSQPRVLTNKTNCLKPPKIRNDKRIKSDDKLQGSVNRSKRDVSPRQKKMEDPSPQQVPYGNIMYDRRIIRGPAFMHNPVPTVGLESQAARQAEARRRAMARRKAQTTRARNLRLRISTPPPVEGRKHEDMQTDQYLEELFETPITNEIFTQTDYFIDRPPTPIFVPVKSGVDVTTQIYPGELFHFDVEVKPILEVLVGKTIEQALVEVMEEDELASIREQQRRFRELRNAEKAEEARLEEEEIRKRREMDMRILEEEEALRDQKSAEDKIAAAVLTTGYIADLLPTVVSDLSKAGFLYDEIKDEVDEKFMPWLMREVQTEIQKVVENRDLLSDILREIIEKRAAVYRKLGMKEDRARETGEDLSDEEDQELIELAGEFEEEEQREEEEENVGEEESQLEIGEEAEGRGDVKSFEPL